MARRASGSVPGLQHHKATGQGKVHLSGRNFYCGKWGTPSCEGAYDRLIAEWLSNGRRRPVEAGLASRKASRHSPELSCGSLSRPDRDSRRRLVSGDSTASASSAAHVPSGSTVRRLLRGLLPQTPAVSRPRRLGMHCKRSRHLSHTMTSRPRASARGSCRRCGLC